MRKKLLLGILSIASLICVVAVAFSASYAWLTPGKPIAFDADGTAVAGYFGGGTGTEEEPYLLMTPKHVYNLAWLQYMGTFNETVTENGEVSLKQQYYFELADDIDMSSDPQWQIIPPIGTMEHPFVGNFDGNNHTISNAIIANTIQTGQQRPPAVENLLNGEIIGFFGVIGEYDDQKLVSTKQLGELKVSNLVLKNITVRTSTEASLAGLFAGFVNGTIDNIKVNSGGFESSKENQTPYSVVWAEGFVLNEGGAYSLYTLIGDYYTTRIKWDEITGPSTDSGQGAGFGGSIDMLTLAKRITYMYEAATSDTVAYKVSFKFKTPNSAVRTNNHAFVRIYGTSNFTYVGNGETAKVLYINEKTYLPLNIDLKDFGQGQYTATSAENVLPGNTGYIVGKKAIDGPYGTTDFSLRGRLIGQICNSMQGGVSSKDAWKNLEYTEDTDKQLQILTKGIDGKYYVIGDSFNGLTDDTGMFNLYKETGEIHVKTAKALGLTQYDVTTANKVRTKLGEMLKSSGMMYGLYFPTDSAPSISDLENVSVTMGEDTMVDSLVRGTVHFVVKYPGSITMVAATFPNSGDKIVSKFEYGQQSRSYYIPMLYRVVRDDDNDDDIDRLDAIYNICQNNSTKKISYNEVLGSDGQAPAGYTLLYNYETMGNLTSNTNGTRDRACMQSLFYFEIPVDSGEFVLGGNGISSTESAYLIYLDIGANAGSTPGPGENPDLDESQGATISGVYFATEGANSTNIEKYFKVSKTEAKSAGSISFMADINTSDITQSFSNMTSTPVAKQEKTSSAGGS